MQISVITICKDDRQGLQRTRASLLDQERQDWEHIVIDSASEDGTVEYLQQQAAADPRLRVVSEPDRGRYDAMNKGAALANGELLWFMHARDRFASPAALQQVLDRTAQQNASGWGYGFSRVLDAQDELVAVGGQMPFNVKKLLLGTTIIPHQASFIRRDLFSRLQGFDETVGLNADQVLLLAAALDGPPVLVPEFLCDFDSGGVGSTQSVAAHYRSVSRMRRRAGASATGSLVIDDAISTGLAALEQGSRSLSRRLASRAVG